MGRLDPCAPAALRAAPRRALGATARLRPLVRRLRAFASVLSMALPLLVGGCSSVRPWQNGPLAPGERPRYDGLAQVGDPARDGGLLVVASFSGGGSRAAAFAHAVLAELHADALTLGQRRTSLADEIDVVIGVSGGSIAAAHLALHGAAESVARFPGDFLGHDLQSSLIRSMAAPANLHRMTSPWFGRTHVLSAELDALLFGGRTFGDLADLAGRPYLIVGATDLSTGADFDFTSEQFSRICSSIDKVPLSFAVAASSSVPVLLSPLTLRNHRHACDARPSPEDATAARSGASARARLVSREARAYADPERQFVHLVDGGIADNLGTRRITDYVASFVFRDAVERWRKDLRSTPGMIEGSDVFAIELRLDELADPALRDEVLSIPTALRISDAHARSLRQAARAALAASPEYGRLRAALSVDQQPPRRFREPEAECSKHASSVAFGHCTSQPVPPPMRSSP